MIKYIGSKRVLVDPIVEVVRSLPEVRSVVDYFSGTSRVGHALKRAGYQVHANDWMAYGHALAQCYIQADAEQVLPQAKTILREMTTLADLDGYVTETFCRQSRFFQPKNGLRIDAIREDIERRSREGLSPELRAVLLVALMEAADRVDSTTGVQMAYLKQWSPRSLNDIQLRLPEVLPAVAHGPCSASQLEAQDAAKQLNGDLAYIDPPYNQHSYLGNYHVWESLVRWDKPEVYGIACKRLDCRERKSDFNSKPKFQDAFTSFIKAVQCEFLVVSFNNEGFLTRPEMEALLQERGDVYTVVRDHKRYVGAQIGIYNPRGDRVGEVGHLRNKEFLYVVVPQGYEWSADQFHSKPEDETPLQCADSSSEPFTMPTQQNLPSS